jgi:hypothetical protein
VLWENWATQEDQEAYRGWRAGNRLRPH